MVVSTTSICRIGPYASEIPRKNRDKISASHWFKLRQTVIPADPSYEKHARAREIVHSACTEGSTTVFSVCDSSSHKLFIALYECNGTVVLPPALGASYACAASHRAYLLFPFIHSSAPSDSSYSVLRRRIRFAARSAMALPFWV